MQFKSGFLVEEKTTWPQIFYCIVQSLSLSLSLSLSYKTLSLTLSITFTNTFALYLAHIQPSFPLLVGLTFQFLFSLLNFGISLHTTLVKFLYIILCIDTPTYSLVLGVNIVSFSFYPHLGILLLFSFSLSITHTHIFKKFGPTRS